MHIRSLVRVQIGIFPVSMLNCGKFGFIIHPIRDTDLPIGEKIYRPGFCIPPILKDQNWVMFYHRTLPKSPQAAFYGSENNSAMRRCFRVSHSKRRMKKKQLKRKTTSQIYVWIRAVDTLRRQGEKRRPGA